MFKSKGATYFLLILTLVIWGFIIYKILFVTQEGQMTSMPKSIKEIERNPVLREALVYHTDYPNPFAKEQRVVPLQHKKTTSVEKKNVVQKNVKKESDEIRLNGVVISNSARTAYMTVNNASIIVQQGDTLLNSYIVAAIKIDSVHIKSKGASRWITKTNY